MNEIKKIMFAEKAAVNCPTCDTQLTTIWLGGLGLLSILAQTAYHTIRHCSDFSNSPIENE